jgi:hypothetical protein
MMLQGITFPALANGSATTWQTGPIDPDNVNLPLRLRLWGDVPKNEQPACFLVTHREFDEYKHLGTLRIRLEFLIYIYIDSSQFSAILDLDNILQAVRQPFITPDNFSNGQQTLGGLVEWIRLEGRVFKDPGDLDKQALMIVPLICELP